MGCLRKIGCLAILLLLGAALVLAWAHGGFRRAWDARFRPHDRRPPVADSLWAPITADGARRAEDQIVALGASVGGPVFATLRPADFAAYATMDIAGTLPARGDSARAAVARGQIWIRTVTDLGAVLHSEPLAWLLGVVRHRDVVELSGTIDVVRPGVAEFRVERIRVNGIGIPHAGIPMLLHRADVARPSADIADNGVLLNLPPYVADVRPALGKVVLYKSMP
jgi:hypothetical protein